MSVVCIMITYYTNDKTAILTLGLVNSFALPSILDF